MKHLTINNMAAEAHSTARAKGWHREIEGTLKGPMVLRKPPTMHVLGLLALIHAEISEAAEEARVCDDYTAIRWGENNEPKGFAVELADAMLRIGDLCCLLGIVPETPIVEKLAYNKTRSHRHGGKLA